MNETTMISLRMDNELLKRLDACFSDNLFSSRSYRISRFLDAVLRTADKDLLFFFLSTSPEMLDSFEMHLSQKFDAVFGEN